MEDIKADAIVRGTLFPEPVQVIVCKLLGDSIQLVGKGLDSGRVYEPILDAGQVATLAVSAEKPPFDGDPLHFRLGIEAMRLGLAYEYDPYFSLSIASVDPLPHQLEAVYDYFVKLPRIRFLLADDPGAGKTIMAGLLLKELKIRGLVKRTLIVTPANLTFQWQREMADKFREKFEIVRGEVLRANYGTNPWQDKNQVITSVSWVSRIEDARDSLLRSHWDMVIVDEAHKMSAARPDHKTLAYELGEALSGMTDHYLLMTATPHKGDPKHFCMFLRLLDADVYGDVKSLEEAMRRNSAPFYLRRTKEALVTFPDPDTGQVKKLFTKRNVNTVPFQFDHEEWDFYDALTRYVEDQSIKAQAANATTGRVIGFTMAMLQRRLASSIYAARRSLERMRDKREMILQDPQAYRQEQISKKLPEDYEDLTDEEQQDILSQLEEAVASVDPVALKEEILELTRLIDQARLLEQREIETKLNKLREVITEQGVFQDPSMKLLVFTEHKDTLDYLVDKLNDWGLSVTQIHGGMKIGDRDAPGTRLHAERIFRDRGGAQVMVATEAAGEGINLQFCWLMINYDIPWNPIRLEQRMGRIHRYGQEKDCLILNFVATNTREGRVLDKLLERIRQIEDDLDPQRTGKVFNVLGDVFSANQLEKMIREMYLHNQTEDTIKSRIVEEIDPDRFRQITDSTLEGLAKRELNLSAIVGKSAEAKERRLVPEVIEDFFTHAGPVVGVVPKETRRGTHIYGIGRVPRNLWPIGDKLEARFGRLGKEYKQIVFDKALLAKDPTSEWVTPGHPLFETVREALWGHVRDDLERGAVFYDLHSPQSYHLDVYSASVKDGLGNELHRRLFVVEATSNGRLAVREPTIFLDLATAPKGTEVPGPDGLPSSDQREHALVEQCLNDFLKEVAEQRRKDTETIRKHIETSLNELIHRQQLTFAGLMEKRDELGNMPPWLAASLKQSEDRIEELNARREHRLAELDRECQCAIDGIRHIGRAWVLPHPERSDPKMQPMVRDDEIEEIAVQAVIAHEEAQGRQVESVEAQNRGFDLISRRPHPEDPATAIDVRFIEVKGRTGIGEVALTTNEYKTAGRLKNDYWLYVVYNCLPAGQADGTEPEVHIIRNPARLGWKPIVTVEHYACDPKIILAAEEGNQ
jgi:superfamily II DNA or RNA helicase